MLYILFQRLICTLTVFFYTSPLIQSSSNYPLRFIMKDTKPKKILALGDSYTIGESVPPTQRWTAQLIEALRHEISVVKHDIVAQTGWTTFELEEAISKQKLENNYDLVTLLIGVNNQYRGLSKDDFRKDFQKLLQIAANFSKDEFRGIIVLSIPDWGVTPFAINRDTKQIAKEIDAFNQIIKEECASKKVVFVDITPISRAFPNNHSMIADDQLHFSGKMYQLWAEEAKQAALKILSR